MDWLSPAELSALGQVILIDLVLAGDNAIVVGMAAAGLPAKQRTQVILIGILAATALRIMFSMAVTQLLAIVGLTLAGGLLLLWVAWKMWREIEMERRRRKLGDAATEEEAGTGSAMPTKTFGAAVLQIIVADVSMSLDNVLAVAGAAREHTWVLIVGLALSVVLMGVAASAIAGLLKRYHWIAYVGLAIIAWVAGEMIWEGTHEVATVVGASNFLGNPVD